MDQAIARARTMLSDVRLTRRTIYGLILLAALLWALAVSELATAVGREREEVASLESRLAIRQAMAEQTGWEDQAAAVQALLEQTQARFWRGSTPGLVAAKVQGVLETAARDSALVNPRITVIAAPEYVGDAAIFEASIEGRDQDGAFARIYNNLQGAEGELRPIRLDWNRISATLTLTFQAPALITPDAAPAQAPSPDSAPVEAQGAAAADAAPPEGAIGGTPEDLSPELLDAIRSAEGDAGRPANGQPALGGDDGQAGAPPTAAQQGPAPAPGAEPGRQGQ